METMLRSEVDNLIEKITKNGTDYSFFQLMSLLEQYETVIKLQLNPAVSLAFPSADINICQYNDKHELLIELNFMGLYGVDTPLPHYFLNMTANNKEAVKNFLDIFNQRFYQLLYQTWKKCQLDLDLTQPKPQLICYLNALSGGSDINNEAYRFAEQFNKRIRSSMGVAVLVKKLFKDIDVHIKQFVPNWVEVSAPILLGKNQSDLCLGHNAVLGGRILDVANKIEIIIKLLPYKKFLQFLPGTADGMQLVSLLRGYLDSRLMFDLIFIVESTARAILTLGDKNIQVGLNSWLGKQNDQPYLFRISGERFC